MTTDTITEPAAEPSPSVIIGNYLKMLRLRSGYSVRDFGQYVGIPYNTYWCMEQGRLMRLNTTHLTAIANAYHFSFPALIALAYAHHRNVLVAEVL